VFVRSAGLPGEAGFQRLAGEPGWSVVRSTAPLSPAVDGPASRRLRGLLGSFVLALEGTPQDSPGGLVVIDDRVGRELAATFPEAVETALRLRVPTLHYRGVDVELPVTLRDVLQGELWAQRSPAVERVLPREAQAVVTFRRYLPPRVLDEQEARLLGLLEGGMSVEELWRRSGALSFHGLMTALRSLESVRVVELGLQASTRLEARLGIS
jgi:hypothetical protein